MSINDASNWRIRDHFPGRVLEDIQPVSARALSLFARRVGASALTDGVINIGGAIDMLGGLDHHHDRFRNCLENKANDGSLDVADERHEAVAYINRVGQFYHFVTSEFTAQRLPDALNKIPAIAELMPLRNKHTAHRSVDAPRKDDHPELALYQAMTLSSFGGTSWQGRPGRPPVQMADIEKFGYDMYVRSMYKNCYLTFSFNAGRFGPVFFNLEAGHSQIMTEGYSVIEALLA